MIILTTTTQLKNPNTKTTYFTDKVEKSLIDKREYNNLTTDDTLKFFRRLGGSEYAERSYTSDGYNITKLISNSPDKQIKKIRNFKFISLPYKEETIFKNLFVSMDSNGLIKLKRFK